MKIEILDDKIIVREKIEKSCGKVRKITTNDAKRFLNENNVSFGDCIMSDLLVSDDETKLSGTWIFSLPFDPQKQSTEKKILDLHEEGVVVPPPPVDTSKTIAGDNKKRGRKANKVLVPSED